ncbi:hypothetical protein ACPXB5_11310 [Micromonospora arida]|uniref:hypothetical protein n=1 Tax=Micromonospora arida TaxID=2203715 RepID=UPI003CF9A6B2
MANARTVKADATGENLTFEHDGKSYTITPPTDWDVEIHGALEDERVIAAVKLILGPAQWGQYTVKPRNLAAFYSLLTDIEKAVGISGN